MKRVLLAILIIGLIAGVSVLYSTINSENEANAAPPKKNVCPPTTCSISNVNVSAAQRSANDGDIVNLTTEQKGLVAQKCPTFKNYTKAKWNTTGQDERWQIRNLAPGAQAAVCLEIKGSL